MTTGPNGMPRQSRAVWLLYGAAICLAAAIGWMISDLLMPGGSGFFSTVQTIAAPPIGGPFTLVDQDGRTRGDGEFRGKLMLVYFGYTHCPDACPTALQDMGDAMAKLGPKADQVTPVFITIDPARDTAEYLKGYATQFDPRFVALTGSDAQIAAAAKGYRVYYRKASDQPDYMMDHTSIIYLMGRDGKFLTHFTHETPPDKLAETIGKYLP